MNKALALSLALVFSLPTFAQSDDFLIDLAVGAEKKINRTIDFEGELQMTTQDNSQCLERYGFECGFSWKFVNTKSFDMKLNAGGSIVNKQYLTAKEDKFDSYMQDGVEMQGDYKGFNITERYWRCRTRESVGFTASYKPNKRWAFSLKETLQFNQYLSVDSVATEKWRLNDDDEPYKKEVEQKHKSHKDKNALRSKLAAQYNIRHSIFSPYASVDYGCGINYTTNKWKLTAGSDIKLNKNNRLNVFYRFQTENDDDEPNGHLLGIAYTIKL